MSETIRKAPFIMKGKVLHSLDELRQNFDQDAVAAAFADGSLVNWLESCYYEREAEAVREVMERQRRSDIFNPFHQNEDDSDEDWPAPSAQTLRELYRVLGIAPLLTPEEKERRERRLAIMKQVTQDPAMLDKVDDTATNQAEMGELLNGGRTTIYLCGGSFSVPIRKAGVHYIGIGSPKMEAPYTEEQYRKAGITFEGINLPVRVDPTVEKTARSAAAANGYDDFPENHNSLAVAFHNALNRGKMFRYYHLKHDGHNIATEFYKSKYQAETAVRRVVDAAYAEAEHHFTPGVSSCVVNEALEHYDTADTAKKLVRKLKVVCENQTNTEKKLSKLEKLVDSLNRDLRDAFEGELRDSSDYYALYEKSYFVERVNIDELDLNEDPFDSDFMNGLARLIVNKSEYSAVGILDSLNELTNDVNQRAETFFSSAQEIYQERRKAIEKLAQEIGESLSAEDIARLKLEQ